MNLRLIALTGIIVIMIGLVGASHGGANLIDMKLQTGVNSVTPGSDITVSLILIGASDGHVTEYSIVDAVITWDTEEADFVGFETFGTWYSDGMQENLMENTINQDLNDGAFYYTAWAQSSSSKSIAYGESFTVANFIFTPKTENLRISLAEGDSALINYGFSSRALDGNGISITQNIGELLIGDLYANIEESENDGTIITPISAQEELQIDALALIWFFIFTLIALLIVAAILHIQNRVKKEDDELPDLLK